MRRSLLLLLAASLAGGCTMLRQSLEDPSKPSVIVKGGRIEAVWPDPLVFEAGQTNVTITWSLPKGSALTFPRNGITFDDKQDEIVRCGVGADPQTYTCLNRHTRPGEFKYTVRVLDAGRPLPDLDPTVRNK